MTGSLIRPLVSVVTPSFNQADFLEETLRSVLSQDYPHVEYLVMDGGSSDGSVEIIRRYQDRLAYWTSAPDGGQADAIADGWRRCRGDVMAYLNSDDTYLPGAVSRAVAALETHPDCGGVYGDELRIDDAGRVLAEVRNRQLSGRDLLKMNFVSQPTVFLRRSALEQVGGFDPDFRLIFDFELLTRVALQSGLCHLPEFLATTRVHAGTRTLRERPAIVAEWKRYRDKFVDDRSVVPELTDADRCAIRARIARKIGFVYLEQRGANRLRGLRHLLRALAANPGLTGITLRALLSRYLLPSTWQPAARYLWRRLRGQPASRPLVHWSEWKPA